MTKALSLVAILVGCSMPVAGSVRGQAMERTASHNLHCPEVEHEAFGEGRHLFKGCGREIEIAEWKSDELHGELSPAASNTFSRENSCPIRATSLFVVDATTQSVAGCGKKITYERTCEGECRWRAVSEMTIPSPP
jgi:hypothetical protein